MEYQLTKEDEKLIQRIEREEKEMLMKYYDLKKSDTNCPKNPYLLKPGNLQLTSYEVLPDNRVKLNVGYMRSWSGYVSSGVRMKYNQYILGTLYCEQVESVKDIDYNRKGQITIPFFSKSKILKLPVQHSHTVCIRCKSISVEDINIYVKNNEGKFILDEIYLKELKKHFENNNNPLNHV